MYKQLVTYTLEVKSWFLKLNSCHWMICFNSALRFITGRHIASCLEPVHPLMRMILKAFVYDMISFQWRFGLLPGLGMTPLIVLRDEVGFMSFPECVWQTRYLLMNRCIEIENKMEKSYWIFSSRWSCCFQGTVIELGSIYHQFMMSLLFWRSQSTKNRNEIQNCFIFTSSLFFWGLIIPKLPLNCF